MRRGKVPQYYTAGIARVQVQSLLSWNILSHFVLQLELALRPVFVVGVLLVASTMSLRRCRCGGSFGSHGVERVRTIARESHPVTVSSVFSGRHGGRDTRTRLRSG